MQILIVGLGYVGSVAAAGLAYAGHEVIGTEIDREKLEGYINGTLPIYEPGLDDLIKQGVSEERLKFQHISEIERITAPVVMICVGTPSRPDGAADISQVKKVISWVRERVTAPTTLVMKSTVPPGTGKKLISDYLGESTGKISYVSNPEFLREGQAVKDWFNPDRIVLGGYDNKAIELVKSLYDNIDAPFVITDVTSAELIKYAANAFLATRISFINEIANLCDYLDADIQDVAQGIGLDPRIGSSFLKAGIGYGGSCFPKDVRALDFLAMVNGHEFELLRSVINVNNKQPVLAVQKLRRELGTLNNKRISLLGLAFKPGTDDLREAPALKIIRLLQDEGARVQAYDPVANKKAAVSLGLDEGITFCSTIWDALHGAEAAIIATEWEEFIELDWEKAKEKMAEPYLILDGRNCLSPNVMQELGFKYLGMGRRAKLKNF
ncbi:UDP-glucose dehydrogenase family protein [Neomoorella thermoacetica]|uniref:UDP-glucose dehydrogenase family protein n=1 Tax=Neomoorella thermoacetica TaxID=1525 RepID=UPI0008FB055B|nr:UDP-glucose/GDP-mannose dehydrogenase family protein [Moorella thermoacetica]OIQ58994.1 UDP-glucose 6-dehydrogenase TuaD [Moorella thermoacetica]